MRAMATEVIRKMLPLEAGNLPRMIQYYGPRTRQLHSLPVYFLNSSYRRWKGGESTYLTFEIPSATY